MPLKTKIVRGNHKPHITKELKKQISIRSKLRRVANETGDEEDIAKYKRQRNFVKFINNKAKRDYFKNLNPKKLDMNKKFFTTFKPFFSSKYTPDERILLIEDNEIISEERTISEIMNEYFTNITENLNIKHWPDPIAIDDSLDVVQKAIAKYKNHPSIIKIESLHGNEPCKFEFDHSTPEIIESEIQKLDSSKSSSGALPTNILKETSNLYKKAFSDCVNSSIDKCKFPDTLKEADIIPCAKKKEWKTQKVNYRPLSVPLALWKVFDRFLGKQLYSFMQN